MLLITTLLSLLFHEPTARMACYADDTVGIEVCATRHATRRDIAIVTVTVDGHTTRESVRRIGGATW